MNPYRHRGNKYGRKKVKFGALIFDSKLELSVYLMLKQNSKVLEIKLQDSVYLTNAKILAKIDFRIELLGGDIRHVEAKGMSTSVWAIKKRLWACYGPNTLEIWGGSHLRPSKIEEVMVSS